MEIEATFITYDKVRNIAEEILRERHPSFELPIPIEEIVEYDYDFEIRGVFGLLKETGSPGALSLNQSIIFVDEEVMAHKTDFYYRFTLAHELGHKIMHGKLFSSIRPGTFDDMKNFYLELPEEQRIELERQANDFAGLILVPTDKLREAFYETDKMIPEQLRGKILEDTVLSYLHEHISRKFRVSTQVIKIRLEKENLAL